MIDIDFVATRQVLVGEGSIGQLPGTLKWHGKSNVMFIPYAGDAQAARDIVNSLEAAGCDITVYAEVIKEPDLAVIDKGAKLCCEKGCDVVVALGGGSVIDAAKTIAMISTNGGTAEDFQLNGREVKTPPLLFIAIPTTAGTGAEATKVSVVYNPQKGFKKAIYHTSMIADVTILDPKTTVGLPPAVTAATGADAITHAIESYTSVFANDFSRMYSLKALQLLADNIVAAYENPNDLAARQNMLLGSYFAGCAISAGTCLAHIVGQPLGAIFSIPHGDACSIFLIPSMELNREYALRDYVDVAKVLGIDAAGKTDDEIVTEGIAALRGIFARINAPRRLTQYVAAEDVDMSAVLDNIQTAMGHIKTNPRPVSRELFEEIIRMVM